MPPKPMPRTPRELFRFGFVDSIRFHALIVFFKATRVWTYPIRAYGDLERMGFWDKVYWLYKTTNPIRRARRHSGLETYFESQRRFRWQLPPGFEAQSTLSLSSAGDLIHHAYLLESHASLYENVADLVFGADITMANLECPVITGPKRDFAFAVNTPPPLAYTAEEFAVVKGIGGKNFTFLATACNHTLDFGLEGVSSTLAALRQDGIAFNGVNENDTGAEKATIIERGGFRIGVVAYTFGLNGFRPPDERQNLVNVMRLNDGVKANRFDQLEKQIANSRKQGVDFFIAHLHWGLEHEFYPTPEQVEMAHHIAELGVDAIIGHHPHVLQPVEYYQTRRDPQRIVPIYYSLGNLVNYFAAPYLCRSGVARLTLTKGRCTDGAERVYVQDATLAEIVQEYDEREKLIRLRPA